MNSHQQITVSRNIVGLIPTDFEQVQRIAKMCVKSGLGPNRADDEEQAIAQASMAIMQGLEIGVPPMQAVQQIAIINGRCVIWGDLIPALIWGNGHEIEEWIDGEGDERVAHCKITRGDNGKVIERTFSVADAKAARLWDTREKVRRKNRNGEWYEVPNDSPWFRFRSRMLQMRARGFCSRDGVADIMRGIYIREELDEFAEPRDITPSPPPPPEDAVPPPPPEPAEEPADEAMTSDELIAHVDACLAVATTIETLDETWEDRMEALGEEMDDETCARARELYDRHCARIDGTGGEQSLPLDGAPAPQGAA